LAPAGAEARDGLVHPVPSRERGVAGLPDVPLLGTRMPELDRREFLKIVGASAGATALAGCSDPLQKLIPYVGQPEGNTPGVAVFCASTYQECPAACGQPARPREGRPIKLEGNPDLPVNKGALCARGQTSLGRTYHPDRFRGPMKRGADGKLAPVSW